MPKPSKEIPKVKQTGDNQVDGFVDKLLSDTVGSTLKSPTQALELLNTIINAYTEVERITETEKTKRYAIEQQSKVALAKIDAQKAVLMQYIEYTFAERKNIFDKLFNVVDDAIKKGDNQQLALGLKNMTDLATSNPFKDLISVEKVGNALEDKNHEWDF